MLKNFFLGIAAFFGTILILLLIFIYWGVLGAIYIFGVIGIIILTIILLIMPVWKAIIFLIFACMLYYIMKKYEIIWFVF